jgi:hypothetical protein
LSTLKVNSIQHSNGTDALTIDSAGNTSFSGVVTGTPLGNRNLIINGDMRIAQRGTSVSGITGSGYYTCDRFDIGGASFGTFTQSQDTDVPTGQGFANSIKFLWTTANASLSTNAFLQMHQSIEGQNLQHLKKGTSNAETVTLSFWVKSNKTGTYIVNLWDIDNTRLIAKAYTINAVDTWEKKTITFAGDTVASFDNDNGRSLDLTFGLCAGTDNSSGTLQTTWGSAVAINRYVGQVNLADAVNNYINFTGVQLEVGDTATPFEHRPYDMELARCQRYYQQISGENTSTGGLGCAYHESATSSVLDLRLNTQMRALPTATVSAASDFVINTPANAAAPSSISFYAHTLSSVRLRLVHVSDSYHARGIRFGATSGRINADAEL